MNGIDAHLLKALMREVKHSQNIENFDTFEDFLHFQSLEFMRNEEEWDLAFYTPYFKEIWHKLRGEN